MVLAGDGTAASGLRGLATELGIGERVTMPGRVPRDTARQWVQALDVVIVPRRDVEVSRLVTPQKPVEAMALSRPVIISDLPALRETVATDDGTVHALTFPAGSAHELAGCIRSAYENRGHAATAGSEIASNRTWPALVQRYRNVYREALVRNEEECTRG